jgi:hypothetical protein
MRNCFKISEIATEGFTNREYGREIRKKIILLTTQKKEIIIDMEKKTGFSISFLDEVFVKTAIKMGKDEFRKKIKLINLSPATKALLNSIAKRRMSTKN